MAEKYHVNPTTGRANICRATKNCPLGKGAPHFDSKDKAKEYVEFLAKQNGETFTQVSKKKSSENDSNNSVKTNNTLNDLLEKEVK